MPFSETASLDSYALALIEDHLEYMKDDDYYKEQGEFNTFLEYFDFMFCDDNQNPDGVKIIDFLKDQLDAGGEITTSSNLFKVILNELNYRIIPRILIDEVAGLRLQIIEEEEEEEEEEVYCGISNCLDPADGYDSCFCKRHECMFERIHCETKLMENAEAIACVCPDSKCTSTKKINIIINLLKALKDDRGKKVDILKREIAGKNMTVAEFEVLFASVVANLDVYGTMENVEKDVEAGIINEEKYINMSYYLKLVHEVKKQYIVE